MIFDLVCWLFILKIDFKFDGVYLFGCSYYQKIVVIDDCFVVCGGIDMMFDCWDMFEYCYEDLWW